MNSIYIKEKFFNIVFNKKEISKQYTVCYIETKALVPVYSLVFFNLG